METRRIRLHVKIVRIRLHVKIVHRRAVGFERVYGLPPKIRVARWKRWFQENRMLSSLDCWVLLAAKPRAEVREL